MNIVYTDLHIHTSLDANRLNENYDVSTLVSSIKTFSSDSIVLISLTDHNIVNKIAYEKLLEKSIEDDNLNFLIGVELSIRNFSDRPFYHCHFFFKEINIEIIDGINKILNRLYPDKQPANTVDVPTLEQLIREFNDFDFLILPHGGQSHRTFDDSIPEDATFDTILEKNLYYNMFDGFTSRSHNGTEKTVQYFKRLGINEVVNLITCSDNYNPNDYPNDRSGSGTYVPTWMFAEPTYNGLRLSLSDSQRLKYINEKPESWAEFIRSVVLNTNRVDINVSFTPGLNVIIGGSSSGKSLLAETLYNQIVNNGTYSDDIIEKYGKYEISKSVVSNPSSVHPHYISQNYISNVIANSKDGSGIESIDIIKNIFKYSEETLDEIKENESAIRILVGNLINTITKIQDAMGKIKRIPDFSRLIIKERVCNPFDKLLPSESISKSMELKEVTYKKYKESLEELLDFSKQNVFFEDIENEVSVILERLNSAYMKSNFEVSVRDIVNDYKTNYSTEYLENSREKTQKINQKAQLLQNVKIYVKEKRNLQSYVGKLKIYNFECETINKESNGDKLTINNKLKINQTSLLEAINKTLKSTYRINNIQELDENTFSLEKLSQREPKIDNFIMLTDYLSKYILRNNIITYEIETSKGKKFTQLSPGWKTAIILDIVLGYEEDFAPIIIDQPEDNLAAGYINDSLIQSIKNSKENRQIIIITHSATIPLLADAQNIILCTINETDDNIVIRSAALEGEIHGKETVDHIVRITDGGKITVKKRIKKYNLKKIFEEEE
ncbi:MAG: ATPase [Firmicutes bacterium]|nr:ATPase [Bacillota bacterium]